MPPLRGLFPLIVELVTVKTATEVALKIPPPPKLAVLPLIVGVGDGHGAGM